MKGKAKMAKKKMMRGGSATKKMQMGGTMTNTGMMNKPVNPLNNTRMRGGGPFLTITSDHVNDECILHDYVFGSYDDNEIFVVLGYGMIYNHSNEPNAEWFVSDCGSFIQFEAVKNINAQEEIFHDYGMEYWNSRNM